MGSRPLGINPLNKGNIDEFSEFWIKQHNFYSQNNNNDKDSYDFPLVENSIPKISNIIEQENNFNGDINKDNEENEEMEEEESNGNDNNNGKLEFNKISDNPPVKTNVFEFNYCQEIENIINNYLNKNYGNQNYHYQNNYIPYEEKSETKKYPKIESIKYKLSIDSNSNNEIIKEVEKENDEEKEEKNKILSDSIFIY